MLTKSVGKFFMAVSVSPLKKSLPLIRNSFTVFPFHLMEPSSPTSTPGNCLTNASSVEPSGTRYALALNIVVSSFCSTFEAVTETVAVPSVWLSACMSKSPTFSVSVPAFISMFFVMVS